MVIAQKPVTAEELFAMPNGNVRRELVRGEVRTDGSGRKYTRKD